MAKEPAYFEPVSPEETDTGDDAGNVTPSDGRGSSSEPSPTEFSRVEDDARPREAHRDPYPLAGPILEGASSRVLRGRCSGCDSRLRVRIEGTRESVNLRCPVCGRTREIGL